MNFLSGQLVFTTGCILLACTLHAQQTHTLSGSIRNEAGIPVANAEIELDNNHLVILSDSSGNFRFQNPPGGKHFLQVRKSGYRIYLKNIAIPQDSFVELVLQDAVVEQQEVVVTGSTIATEKRRSPLAISSIRQSELLQNSSSNIVDALTHIPGVSQISTGPAISKPVIRGLGFNRTVILTDGVRQEGQQWGAEHGLEADDYPVSKVEILKGPASLAYGSDALAGVINILSPNSLPQGQMGGKVLLNYQTNNKTRALHASLGGNQKGFSWNAWGTGKEAADYSNLYDGPVYNSRFRNINFGGSLSVAGSKGFSRLHISRFSQHLGLVEGERDPGSGQFIRMVNHQGNVEEETVSPEEKANTVPELPSQKIRHWKISWESQRYLRNGGKLGFTLGGQQNDRREFEDILNPETPAISLKLKTASYDVRYVLPKRQDWQLTLGVGGMTQQNRNYGEEFLIPDYQLQDGGLYMLANRQKEKWLVSGGVRMDARVLHSEALAGDSGTLRFEEFNRQFTNFSGSLGVSYLPNSSLSFRANAATGYRAPNIAELAANGVHEGTFRYEYGNQSLSAERSFQTDLGMTLSNEHVLADVSVFYNRIANYIYLQKLVSTTGLDSIPQIGNPDGREAYQFRQRDAGLFGGEFFLDIHPHPMHWLHFQNTISYVSGRLFGGRDSMRFLPQMPPFRWTSEVRAELPTWKNRVRNAYLKTGLEYHASQNQIFSAYSTETATPGYWLWSAGAGVVFTNPKGRTICELIVAAQNLANTPWQSHLSRLKYAPENERTDRMGIWGMGRNLSFTVVFPLSSGKM